MDNAKRVIIDGVEYVPIKSVVVDSEKIIKALVAQFWGTNFENCTKEEFDEMVNGSLRVVITDDTSISKEYYSTTIMDIMRTLYEISGEANEKS